jgi:MFS superfamily sulfate permease-like transporter
MKSGKHDRSGLLVRLLHRYLPILTWGPEYSGRTFTNDLVVAGIVTVMLIPQSLAYALLAGLPPQVGLYSSMAPLVLYAIFGTSRALAVGPVAVASLMTAAAAATIASQARMAGIRWKKSAEGVLGCLRRVKPSGCAA